MPLHTCVNAHVCMSMCLAPELNSPAFVFTRRGKHILLIGPRPQCILKDRPGKQGGKSCKHAVFKGINCTQPSTVVTKQCAFAVRTPLGTSRRSTDESMKDLDGFKLTSSDSGISKYQHWTEMRAEFFVRTYVCTGSEAGLRLSGRL